jgi:hypothetical protein
MLVVLALNNKETASSNKPQQKREASHKKDINISSVRSPYKNALFISI